MKLYEKSAIELAEMLKRKECSSVEILKDVMERIEAVEEKIGAYITLNDKAFEQAEAVDKAIANGKKLSLLAGIPIAVKDNISTKGLRTTCASKMLENYIPPYNATVIDKLANAGAVIIGKTNMDEFAMGASTETSYMHITRNPHNIDYVPGGSSGGSAAAVSAGEAIIALGTDTGGSVRQPSAFCGTVGLKPTYSSVSRFGLIAYASSFDQIGVIGKNTQDTVLLYSEICGYDKMDSTSKKMIYPDYLANLCLKASGLKIGIPNEYFDDETDAEVKAAVHNAVKMLEKNGAEVKKITLPSTKYAVNTYYIIACAEASSNLARFDGVKYGYRTDNYINLTDMYEKTRNEGFGDEVKRRIMLGTFVLSSGYYDEYYKKAKLMQKRISAEMSQAFEKCDVIITPTSPVTAYKIGEKINEPLKMYAGDRFTVTANIAGLPAISVPCGKDRNGFPIGMQIIADKFKEQLLFNTAYTYEKLCGGFDSMSKKI